MATPGGPNQTFAVANDDCLIELISSARNQRVVVAPALTTPFAMALADLLRAMTRLGIAKLAGLVDLLAGEANIGGGRWGHVMFGNMPNRSGFVLSGRNLAPLLRSFVLIREAAN